MPTYQSPQSQAIQVANNIIAASLQLMTLYQTIQEIDQCWVDDAVANTMAQWQTVSVNLDGSLANVSDGVINTAHPFNPEMYPGLTRPVSSLQITQAKTILDGIIAYVSGNAVTTQPGARAILDALIGG